MKSDGYMYKLVECQICKRTDIIGSTNHADPCHGSRMKKIAGLKTKPVAALVSGKWQVANLGIDPPDPDDYGMTEEAKKGCMGNQGQYGKAVKGHANLRSKIICAIIPSLLDKKEEIDFDACREMFQMKLFQTIKDSCPDDDSLPTGRFKIDRSKTTEEIRDEAREYIFSTAFKDICIFVDIDYKNVRNTLIRRWAGLGKEIAQIEPEDDPIINEYLDEPWTESDNDYDIEVLNQALGLMQGTREALASN